MRYSDKISYEFAFQKKENILKSTKKNLKVAPLRNVRNSLSLALESNIIDDEEFLLLYKLNLSKNPDLYIIILDMIP